jgi:hypothetical protein
VVECDLAKVEVAGSNPVSRSIFHSRPGRSPQMDIFRTERQRGGQGRGTQVVRERSAKPLCVGSIPTSASNFSCSLLDSTPRLVSPNIRWRRGLLPAIVLNDRDCCANARESHQNAQGRLVVPGKKTHDLVSV